MLKLQDFQYVLPQELIAQTPAEPRDSSRLMVVDRIKKELTHKIFSEIPDFLRKGDVLVLNNSKTIPGRTVGLRPAGKPMEVLFLNPLRVERNDNRNESNSTTEEWEVLSKPGLKVGQEVQIQNSPLHIHVLEDLGYTRRVRVTGAGQSVLHELESCGTLPLPPYIRQSPQDQNRYQTLYAKTAGSAATPTAGLHFTPRVLDHLRELGVIITELTLHVGLGTFLPVKVNDLESHRMHSEWYEMSPQTASVINQAKTENRRVIAVGTTSIRTLESCVDPEHSNRVSAGSGDTDIFLYPPYRFRIADGLVTNFHLPASTLLMLISAFCSQHEPFTTFADSLAGKAYQEAIQERYRFFSFGDAMLIL